LDATSFAALEQWFFLLKTKTTKRFFGYKEDLKTRMSLDELFRQQSLTQALSAIYGPIRLDVVSQGFVDCVPPTQQSIFGEVREPLMERHIRLFAPVSGEKLQPLIYAISWIRWEAISPSGRADLRAGQRMLGEILVDEDGLTMREIGLKRAAFPLAARALDMSEEAQLLLRLRCWSNALNECVVLLQECACESQFAES
jgi:chorismate-pyruvate lyase